MKIFRLKLIQKDGNDNLINVSEKFYLGYYTLIGGIAKQMKDLKELERGEEALLIERFMESKPVNGIWYKEGKLNTRTSYPVNYEIDSIEIIKTL